MRSTLSFLPNPIMFRMKREGGMLEALVGLVGVCVCWGFGGSNVVFVVEGKEAT